MADSLNKRLEKAPVSASAPCRVDMGGTLDISTFYYPLSRFAPCTFNIALDMRTRVRLLPYRTGRVKVSSMGFPDAAFPDDRMPFDHPFGLMFAVAAYFGASGVHIEIESASPPRSALGGSSTAAVALVAACFKALNRGGAVPVSRRDIALLAQALEASVAGVPCGLQDQLAAAYGGVNAWHWQPDVGKRLYRRRTVVSKSSHRRLEKHLLLAYCGVPHASRDVNGTWVRQFLAGRHRRKWEEISALTRTFVLALKRWHIRDAVAAMNRETEIRMQMTPGVVDSTGALLVEAAARNGCGARFTGAGGGGCIWAFGEPGQVGPLREGWQEIAASRPEACLLDVSIDSDGLIVNDD